MTVKIEYFPLEGGEDLATPTLSVKPGRLRFSLNYECDRYGRYRRVDGYERFDGNPKPSEASYWVLDFDAGESEISVEDTVEGGTSGATGEALVVEVESGSWAGSDAAGYLILFNVSGTFQDNEDLEVSSTKMAVADGAPVEQGADNDTDHNTWIQAAIEATRDDISVVPGSGNILGVWQYNGVKYAFRNNAGDTAAVMFKSSSTGWTECDLGKTIAFTSGGTYEVQEDDTITGATSGATAVVKRIIVSSGTWAGGDAAGTFVIYSQTGTFQSENLNVGAELNVATIAGNSTATTLSKDGRYEFENYNFGGHSGTFRMYGCDGVNKGFEWDGSVFVPITTGMATDTPEHLRCHKKHLFFSFTGGSLQHSSTGDPYTWSAVTGAAELGIGAPIVGLEIVPGDVLGVYGRNSINLLYGSSVDDWDLKTFSRDSGAIEWTSQRIGNNIVFLDDGGLTSLAAVQEYGDFSTDIMSKDIQPFLDTLRGYEQASIKVRKKNQYRLFFSDGHGLVLTLSGNKVIGFTRIKYDDPVMCCCSSEDSSGNEELYFGSSDGFVYQMDKGTSFDGGAVSDYLLTHYNVLKSPSYKKRFRKLTIELDAPNYITLYVTPEFTYGGSAAQQSSGQELSVNASGGTWDLDAWGSFVWDGPFVSTGEAIIDGSGLSISLAFYHTGIYDIPHTIQGAIIHYSIRGLQR
jgi:hypothetical protein